MTTSFVLAAPTAGLFVGPNKNPGTLANALRFTSAARAAIINAELGLKGFYVVPVKRHPMGKSGIVN